MNKELFSIIVDLFQNEKNIPEKPSLLYTADSWNWKEMVVPKIYSN